jgi:hypothetical protein
MYNDSFTILLQSYMSEDYKLYNCTYTCVTLRL